MALLGRLVQRSLIPTTRRSALPCVSQTVHTTTVNRNEVTLGAIKSALGDVATPTFTHEFSITHHNSVMPTFQLMAPDGTLRSDEFETNDEDLAKRLYKSMAQIAIMDGILYEAQRQGRISFYMTCTGEEGMVAVAAALNNDDEIFAQYREQVLLLWRGFDFNDFCNQCCSNDLDTGKGRQMPVHYGSSSLHFQQVSSPLGTQIPQAAGAAYQLKLNGENRITACFFGDGAASEGDFHAALNFAATLSCPVLFVCRNNGYAISTPVKDQYRGDGIASRAAGYGMSVTRVDGNDVWAIYHAVKRAREFMMEHQKPMLIELMSYRGGHHSTSDDSTRYRSVDEINFMSEATSPITRMRDFLKSKGWWHEEELGEAFHDQTRQEVLDALTKAEQRPKPDFSQIFTDVYDEAPPNLREQEARLVEHMKKYPDEYTLERH